MRRQLIGCGVLVLALGTRVAGQTPPAPQPGIEHKALSFFVGKWASEGEMKPGPMGAGGRFKSTDACEAFAGGFQVVCRGQGDGPMGHIESMGVVTYSGADKVYTYYGIDSMGSSELAKGQKTGDTWTFTSTSHYGGQTFQSRYTMVMTSPTSYTFKWETSPDGTKWTTVMEGTSTKSS